MPAYIFFLISRQLSPTIIQVYTSHASLNIFFPAFPPSLARLSIGKDGKRGA